MDDSRFHDFIEFYQEQLYMGFYQKKGKSTTIPHIFYAINRLLEQGRDDIKILDVGCGKGDFLELISSIAKRAGYSNSLELYGIDKNRDLLDDASRKDGFILQNLDLRHDDLSGFRGKFDIVVCINTLHEVFSSLIGENTNFPEGKFAHAQKTVEEVFDDLSSLLNDNGTFIFYDGVDVPKQNYEKEVAFSITSTVLRKYFRSFIRDFKPWRLKYTQAGEIIRMNQRDFLRFLTTFKYLNSKLWPIEKHESYHYFDEKTFRRLIKKNGLIIDSLALVANDLSLWSANISLQSGLMQFPFKAIMISFSKKYIPSKYDYFVS